VKVRNPTGRHIVVMKTKGFVRKSSGEVTAFAQGIQGVKDVKAFGRSLSGFSAKLEQAALQRLAVDPAVAFVQEDGEKHISLAWGLDRIDQRNLPLDGMYEPDEDGTLVEAYIIDTGIDPTHPEFTARLGEGFSVFGGLPDDFQGHGTHVAATVGGKTFGVAKGIRLHAVRVLDANGSGTDSGVIQGIDWVTEHVIRNHRWSAVANMSLGGGISPALDLAVRNSIAEGVTYAVAAGNDFGADACDSSPARVSEALTVGASGIDDQKADFSNVGRIVDVFAPGVDIISARRGGGSTVMSGTSMATPHVAGVAALYLGLHLGALPERVARDIKLLATHDLVRGVPATTTKDFLFARVH
jgi:subtilisin family serine protease